MNIALKPKLKQFVEKQVKTGRYDSTDDLFAAAVTRLMQDDDFDFAPGELQALVDKGESDIAIGKVHTMEQVKRHFEQRKRKVLPNQSQSKK